MESAHRQETEKRDSPCTKVFVSTNMCFGQVGHLSDVEKELCSFPLYHALGNIVQWISNPGAYPWHLMGLMPKDDYRQHQRWCSVLRAGREKALSYFSCTSGAPGYTKCSPGLCCSLPNESGWCIFLKKYLHKQGKYVSTCLPPTCIWHY